MQTKTRTQTTRAAMMGGAKQEVQEAMHQAYFMEPMKRVAGYMKTAMRANEDARKVHIGVDFAAGPAHVEFFQRATRQMEQNLLMSIRRPDLIPSPEPSGAQSAAD